MQYENSQKTFSDFSRDLEIENCIREMITVPKFWNRYFNDTNYDVVMDTEIQKLGIDIRIHYKNKIINIDEKCSTQVFVDLQNDPPTWALEIMSGLKSLGYLVDPKKVSQYYLHIHIRKWSDNEEDWTTITKENNKVQRIPNPKLTPIEFVQRIKQVGFLLEKRTDIIREVENLTEYDQWQIIQEAEKLKTGERFELDYVKEEMLGKKKISLLRSKVNGQYPVNLIIPFWIHLKVARVYEVIDIE